MERAARPASLLLGAASLLAVVWAVVARSVVGGAIAVALGTLAIAAAVMAERTVRAVFKPTPAPATATAAKPAAATSVASTPSPAPAPAPAPEPLRSEPTPTPEPVAEAALPQPVAWSASEASETSAVSAAPAEQEPAHAAPDTEAPEEAAAQEVPAERPLAMPASSAVIHALPEPAEVPREEHITDRGRVVYPSAPDIESVVAALLATVGSAYDVRSAHVWLRDDDSETLRLLAAAGAEPPRDTPVPLSDPVLGEASTSDAWTSGHNGMSGETPVWRIAVPVSSDHVRGVAGVDIAGDAEPDPTAVLSLLLPLQCVLAAAIALHVAQHEATAAETLLSVARDLGRLLDPNQVVSVALDHAMRLSEAQTGSVLLLEPDGALRIAVARGLPDEIVRSTKVSEGDGIAGWVLASGQPLVVEDLNGSPKSRRHGVRSAVSVPVADDDGILGVLNVGSRRYHARFSKAHLEALEALGRITALSLRNARAARESSELYFDSLRTLALALETKDPYAQGGTDRILELVELLAGALGVDESQMYALRIAAMLHDVGMSAAGDVVAIGDRPLSTVEWGLLKMHPSIAGDILAQAPALREVAPIVYHHHEHYDGRGYVAGIAGEGIPLGARILAVADAYVAMTSERPYRGAMSEEQALAELKAKAGSQFDPQVVAAFLSMRPADQAESPAEQQE